MLYAITMGDVDGPGYHVEGPSYHVEAILEGPPGLDLDLMFAGYEQEFFSEVGNGMPADIEERWRRHRSLLESRYREFVPTGPMPEDLFLTHPFIEAIKREHGMVVREFSQCFTEE